MKTPYCILLTGEPNCGKSTLAYHLLQGHLRNCLVIDGDAHRQAQFLGRQLGFSKKDIMENNEHVIKLAQFAQEQDFNVLIPQIAPYKAQREAMRERLINFTEVFLSASKSARRGRPNFKDTELRYEFGNPDLIVYTDSYPIAVCVEQIMEFLNE
jgi:adenylylsulfate kinase-like enzyme